MIRILMLSGALALFGLPVAAGQADGLPNGYEPRRAVERPVDRLRPRRYAEPAIHRHRARPYRSAHALLPSTLPTHPAQPLYNVPPQRFPGH